MSRYYMNPEGVTKAAGRAHNAAENLAEVKVFLGLNEMRNAMPGAPAASAATSAGGAVDSSLQGLAIAVDEFAAALERTRDRFLAADKRAAERMAAVTPGSVLRPRRGRERTSGTGDAHSDGWDIDRNPRNVHPAPSDSEEFRRHSKPGDSED
ncbi:MULTISPECIES: hypothetical protein [unclassified Actinobaculum]|uniref:hypothetical protein n=1 Tax=unclassified Actinobaculum TaxID=2609299 RepID=UPI000D5284B5|nr:MULTISPECIES: hypothetical protein [unclassified Actinobaculum]AWE42056.1 hypothetical protein DDD63_03960 [Actinobaculum sp. 313]RTE50605.1 hypothetical protein EKN07_00125 [Actinobaculum sp. 352]